MKRRHGVCTSAAAASSNGRLTPFHHHGMPRWSNPVLLLLCLLGWIPTPIISLIPPNGKCVLNILLPFSINLDLQGRGTPVPTALFTKSRLYSLGYVQLAAAVMAMEHFNTRNGTIAPELEELQDCNIQFDLDQSMFLDTGSMGHTGNNLVYELAQTRNFPLCALVGPYNNMPAENIALLAAAAETPHIPHQGYTVRLSNPEYSPMTANINPDIVLTAEVVAAYLEHIHRDNYIAVVHPTTEFGAQAKESLTVAFNKRRFEQFQVYGYFPPILGNHGGGTFQRIPAVLERVKERGFRTILVSLDVFFTDLAALADTAQALNMLNGDYLWVFMPLFEAEAIHNAMQLPEAFLAEQGIPSFGNVSSLLRGAVLIRPVDKYQTTTNHSHDDSSFLDVWKQQDADFVQRVNDAYVNKTIHMGVDNGFLMLPDFFQTYAPEPGTATIYDSIMAVGIGACKAQKNSNSSNTNVTAAALLGKDHFNSIVSLDFHGANGRVLFGDSQSNFTNLKVRRSTTVTFGVWNMYPPSTNGTEITTFEDAFVLTEIGTKFGGPYAPAGTPSAIGKWTQHGPLFVFANGQVTPPELLRDVPEQNYLPKPFQILGFSLMSVSLLSCVLSMIFVVVQWKHKVIMASQPYFLFLLLAGAALTSTAIATISFDESYGWDENSLSIACMATPWLFCVGHIITYGALFSKLWRVNKVLQFARRKISATAVAGPLVVLLFTTVCVLLAWTLHDPLVWIRFEVDGITGESIGRCESGSGAIYIPLLAALLVTPTVLTCIFAYKTKDVDESFSESTWIFTLIVVQLQVILVAIPIVIILRDISTEGRYMGLTICIWIFPASTVVLIMCPKFLAWWGDRAAASARASSSESGGRNSRGSGQRGPRMSGLSGESTDHNSQMESVFVNGSMADRSSVKASTRISTVGDKSARTSSGTR